MATAVAAAVVAAAAAVAVGLLFLLFLLLLLERTSGVSPVIFIVVVDNTAVLTTETKLCFRPQLPQLERLPHKMTMPMDPCKINEIILYKLAHVNSI